MEYGVVTEKENEKVTYVWNRDVLQGRLRTRSVYTENGLHDVKNDGRA